MNNHIEKVETLRGLLKEGQLIKAMSLAETLSVENPLSPFIWIVRARLEMLEGGSDDNPFGVAEGFLMTAYDINPNDIECLEELVHFYDVIDPNEDLAKKYAAILLAKIDALRKDIGSLFPEKDGLDEEFGSRSE